MANDLQTGNEPSVTSLVTGIINDAQELFKQQLAFFRKEVEGDMRKSRDAAIPMAAGLGLALVGVVFLCFMLAHLLHWATEMPLWAAYGILGVVLAIAGGALFFVGKQQFESFNPLPDETAQAVKENVQWIVNKK